MLKTENVENAVRLNREELFRFGTALLFIVGIMLTAILVGGCSHIDEGTLSQEANQFFNQGNYGAALCKYEQLIANYPAVEDRVLFEMGIVYAYPKNAQKDYQKSLDCFQKIVKDYPDSEYRYDSQMMIQQIHNVIIKDQKIAAQQAALETSRQALEGKADEIEALQEKIEAFEETVFTLRMESADKVLIEKQARRLSLLSKGEVVKSYKIALGGNPVGPKERQGDNKTPEGTYRIDAKNGNSGFHLSLHISYPNENDKKRAKKLGVSPGGDIMIHGQANGWGWAGPVMQFFSWTDGCVALSDRDMDEVWEAVNAGTPIEIRP